MAVNKVVLGEDTLIDLTADTVSADKLSKGVTAHDMAGEAIIGTMEAGGVASADEATIITNAEGKLETVIGGKWVDGLVDGPTIVNISSTDFDVTTTVTYDIMQELISKGDKLRAYLASGFGTEKGCLVDIDTSAADTYKLTCKYTISSIKIVYTGIGTKDNWKCTREFVNGSSGF